MNSLYEVFWTHVAENDLKDIAEFIAEEDRPQTALKILKQIKKKAQNLYTLPENRPDCTGTPRTRNFSVPGNRYFHLASYL